MKEPELITIPQASSLTGKSRSTIHYWIKQGWITSKRYGRDILVNKTEILGVKPPSSGWRKGQKRNGTPEH